MIGLKGGLYVAVKSRNRTFIYVSRMCLFMLVPLIRFWNSLCPFPFIFSLKIPKLSIEIGEKSCPLTVRTNI